MSLLLLLKPPPSPAAATELNTDAFEIIEVTQQMGRASTCRFRPRGALCDDTTFGTRDPVKITIGGVKV
ncbi:MAG TPA: hypothetical protein VK176_16570, partial [Phycisphaerales bacterium]|nr:hypothetical protein [Phycisphaerales bacterium]